MRGRRRINLAQDRKFGGLLCIRWWVFSLHKI